MQEHMNLRNGFTVSIIEQIGKPTMPEDLTDLDHDAETPVDEVYQDELEGTGHVSDADADADAATLEDLDCYGVQVPASMYKMLWQMWSSIWPCITLKGS